MTQDFPQQVGRAGAANDHVWRLSAGVSPHGERGALLAFSQGGVRRFLIFLEPGAAVDLADALARLAEWSEELDG